MDELLNLIPDFLKTPEARRSELGTLVVIVVITVIRVVAVRAVKRSEWSSEPLRLSWLARIRTACWLAMMLGLVLVWATELQTLAVSAVAIAAALVLATKELIACVTGGIVRKAGGSFQIGDRIEVGVIRGDVIAHGIMTTTILEAGPGHQRTGRAVTIPNSVWLVQSVVNETFTQSYVLHVFSIVIARRADWKRAEQVLLEVGNRTCAPWLEAARTSMQEASAAHGLTPPSVDPRVLVQLPDAEKITLLLRVPAPAREKSRTEQDILRGFLEHFHAEAPTAPEAPTGPSSPGSAATGPAAAGPPASG